MTEANPPSPSQSTDRRRWSIVALAAMVMLGVVGYFVIYPMWLASHHFELAKALLVLHDLPEAKRHLEQVIAIRSDNAEAEYLLAQTLRRLEEYREAEVHLRKSQTLDWVPDLIEMEHRLTRAQLMGPQGENEAKLRLWLSANHPHDRIILDGMVRGYRNAFFTNQAMGLTATWIQRYPDDWLPHAWRGEMLRTFNRLEEALPEFEKAMELNPEELSVQQNLGEIRLQRPLEPVRAEVHFQAVLDRRPKDLNARMGLAQSFWYQSRIEEARAILDGILAEQPRRWDALVLRAKLDEQDGNLVVAVERLTVAEKQRPGEYEILYLLARYFPKLQQNEDAIRYDRKLKQFQSDQAELEPLSTAVLNEPTNNEVRSRIGFLLLRMGKTEQALGWLHSVLAVDPAHVPTHRTLFEYYRDRQQMDRAEYHRQFAGIPASAS